MGDSIDGNSASGTREGKTSIIGEGEPHAHSITIDAGGSHTHTGSTASSGHIPLFFAKIYIMRSEEHTSELQSLMRISYAVFCLKKKNTPIKTTNHIISTLITSH